MPRRILSLRALIPLLAAGTASCFIITQEDIDARSQGPEEGAVELWAVGPQGYPVAGLNVSAGAVRATTDEAGYAHLGGLSSGQLTVSLQGTGRSPEAAHLELTGGAAGVVRFTTYTADQGTIHRLDRGGAVVRDGVFSLAFPANALTLAGAVDGYSATVNYRWIEPGEDAPAMALPTGEPLDLFSIVWVEGAEHKDGPLELSSPATLRVPVAPNDERRALTGLAAYVFDVDLGGWVEVGPLELEENYLSGQFDQFGWWALGAPARSSCVTGTLSAGGQPLASASVRTFSPGAPGRFEVHTDQAGNFCVPARLGSNGAFEVWAHDGQNLAHGSLALEPLAFNGSCEDDTCEELGKISLKFLVDADGDGVPEGAGGDCDDQEARTYPGATDAAGDGVDTNCDGVDGVDADHDGYATQEDCEPANPDAYPGGVEVCDLIDNDCDQLTDEEVPDSVPDASESSCVHCDLQAIIDLGPRLFWSMDPQNGWMIDHSGWGHDGKITGLPTTLPGINNDVPFFEGVRGHHIRVADLDDWPTTEITVAVWYKTALQRRALFSYFQDPQGEIADEFALRPAVPGGVSVLIDEMKYETYEVDPPLNAWNHLAFTWRETGEVQVWLNGKLAKEELMLDVLDTGLTPEVVVTQMAPGGILYLGQDQDELDGGIDSWQAWQGLVDDVLVFDRVLGRDEIRLLYDVSSCGEGALCDGLDNDDDGVVDEHLIGTVSCPADDCQEVLDNEASLGDGAYWVGDLSDPVPATCESMDSAPIMSLCGDGVVSSPTETCDNNDVTKCDRCAIVVSTAPTCMEVLNGGETLSGPYVIDIGQDGTPDRVRCDMTTDGGGWTQVLHHDTFAQAIAFIPVQTDPYAEGPQVTGVNEDQPLSPLYSILGKLDQLSGTPNYEFRLEWPGVTTLSNQWTQTSNPIDDVTVQGYTKVQVDCPEPSFHGLELSDGSATANPKPNSDLAFLDGTEDSAEHYFSVGTYLEGVRLDDTYLLLAAPCFGDGTAPAVRLWVR